MAITWEPGWIKSLASNEVFVFGSNNYGLHGGGAAGWGQDQGWCRWGIARGFQSGPNGWSYGISTIHEPGLLRSVTLADIRRQANRMLDVAWARPDLTFVVTPLGECLAGYSGEEMAREVWDRVSHRVPANVRFIRPN